VSPLAPARGSRTGRLALLSALYFAQGLPFGFQTGALPILLRERGASLTAISFASALALPWMLKWLWAPLVDRYGSARFGRRRSWLLPLQALLAISALIAALAVSGGTLWPVLVMVAVMNLIAATQDIATDGLAVDALAPGELGLGNAAQVVGYKLGMLTSGGLLLALFGERGFAPVFLGMAALCGAVMLLVLWMDEAKLAGREEARAPAEGDDAHARRSLREVVSLFWRALLRPGLRWALILVASYKVGESLNDVMFKPFLVDAGFTRAQLGLWSGTWGAAASIAGSLAGGLLAARTSPLKALQICALLRVAPLITQWWLAARGAPQAGEVIAVILCEEAFGGALTTAMFAFMMGMVDRRVGATHFTALAALEVLGKMPSGLLAGPIAQQWGYALLFGIGSGLSLAFLLLWFPARREQRRAQVGAASAGG